MLAASLALIMAAGPWLNPTSGRAQEGTPELTPGLIEHFRVETYEIGTLGNWNVNHYMIHEEDALVLTRTAMGEAPDNLEDRVLVMWLIRIRAELGYKNGRWGFVGTIDRWGPPSTIKMESLCIGGCQFEVWRAAQYVVRPDQLAHTGILRKMLHPTDEQLEAFYLTYLAAREIVNAPIEDAPEILRGYDGFLSPGASDTHYIDWKPNGLKRLQLSGEGGNVWIDHFKQDNHFWNLLPGRLELTATAESAWGPLLTASAPTKTPTPTIQSTPTVMPTLTLDPKSATLNPVKPAELNDHQTEETPMDFLNFFEGLIRSAGPQITTLLALLGADVVLGLAVAIKDGEFEWQLIADFYRTEIIPKGLGYIGVMIIVRFGALEFVGPGLGDALGSGLETVSWLAIVVSLGGSILVKLGALGIKAVQRIPGVTNGQ